MATAIRLMVILAIWCAGNISSDAELAEEVDGPEYSKESGVTIELTRLEVTESFLALSYKIRNGSSHDVWICSRVSSTTFELFLTHDKQTLLIRRRLDVPTKRIWHRPPSPGTYTRLRPGAEQTESLQIDLPATTHFEYIDLDVQEVAWTPRRLALEIGYYDTDLPALIGGIFAIADKFSLEGWSLYPEIRETYFRGLGVRGALADFYDINKDPDGTGCVHIGYSYQALTGEKVLRMEVNGVAIPYKGRIESE